MGPSKVGAGELPKLSEIDAWGKSWEFGKCLPNEFIKDGG